MKFRTILIAIAIAVPSIASAQSSNTSSNSSSNNGVVRERTVDTYCDDGYCTRLVERNVYRDGSNRDWKDDRWDRRDNRRADSQWRFDSWALQNFDRNRDGRLNQREYDRALYAYRRR